VGLSAGITIGPYQIERALGRGGMGVVYLAKDARLDRFVAIKALPDDLAGDSDRLARFQREAKVLASLNHAGIGAIYGFEESAGRQFLILEYVDGQTLAERLARGPLPVEEALSVARQIAEGLEAAHEKGVIHRDLKPGNVMVTPDGVAKVLDFGIARMPDRAVLPVSPGAPTVKSPAHDPSPTIPGAIMGSPGYMSPEQALGKNVDKRSDIFAFGCVLYEMLAGAQAFPGENVTASLAAVLHLEPDWSRLPASTPPRIRDLLHNLLTKERRQRLHDISDARLALDHAIQNREWFVAGEHETAAPRRAATRVLAWALATTFVVAAAFTSWRALAHPRSGMSGAKTPIRMRADIPGAPPASTYNTSPVAISDDGEQIAYAAFTGGRDGFVAVRRLDEPSFHRVPFIDVDPYALPIALDIMFSPDGSRIAGFQQSSVFVNSAAGGEPLRLYAGEFVSPKGGVWLKQGAGGWNGGGGGGILFSPAPNSGLKFVSEKGGVPEVISVPDASRGEISHRYPDVLPDDRRVLITIKKDGILSFDDAEIALLDLKTKTWKTILKGGSYARYISTGHMVFARNGSIMAVPFDVERGEVNGTPVAVISGVMTAPGSGSAAFAVARDAGTLAYIPGGADETRSELIWVDLDGKVESVGAPIMSYSGAAMSPDGGKIVAGVWGANDAIFVYDLTRRTSTRITYRGNSGSAQWTPDGSQVVYASDVQGPMNFFITNADGSGEPRNLGGTASQVAMCYASIDGKSGMVFAAKGDIWFQPLSNEPQRKLVGSQFEETSPSVSPDGRWLSYASNETGQHEVYIRPLSLLSSSQGRWPVSVGGGRVNCWMPKSDAIVYIRESDRAVLRAPIQAGSSPRIGSPVRLFTLFDDPSNTLQPSLDGKRFLALRTLPAKYKADQVCIVLNWLDELKAKVPSK